jgi:hypothetical protein
MKTCRCCGFDTIEDTYNICKVCQWQQDDVQEDNPWMAGGANKESLRQSQAKYIKLESSKAHNISIANKHYSRDRAWRPFE